MTRKADPQTRRLPVAPGELPAFTPVPRKTKRHDGWTTERQIAFIEALADTGSVAGACKRIDMSTVGAYYLRRQPGADSFREAWAKALDLGVERLEDIAMERAIYGVEEPYYIGGEQVATRTRYNDRLLMFMLRNRAPERFGASVNGASLKGLNAVGKMERRRLKKKWRQKFREQWEAERDSISPQDLRASIDAKIEGLHRTVELRRNREFERLSPKTRRAFVLYEKLRARDEERLATEDAVREEEAKRQRVTINAKPPVKEPEPVKERKTVHSLKNESFEAHRWITTK